MALSEYDDLQLRIDRDADGSYRVLAMAPDGRIARGSFTPPVTDRELDEFVQRVGLARRRSGSADARMQAIRELGSNLFDALIRDDVGTVYHSARSAAAERDRGLRLTLRLSGSPELMRLPWEFLYRRPRFIAQSTRTPVVRALDVDSAMHPQVLRLPLRILAMVSSPSGYPELDAEVERRNLERALAVPRAAGLVEVTWLDRATLGELGRRIAEPDEIHVLHYIGHGAYDEATEAGVLVLETPQGRAHDVSGEEIGAMLQDETSLRLVVLNACEGARSSHVDPFSGVAASLVHFDIPAVIGMQFEITDDAAIAFSESLYTGLARGLPIDAALAPARRAIMGAMLPTEFGTPVLFLRDGDARLFDVTDAPPTGAITGLLAEPSVEESEPSPIPDEVELEPAAELQPAAELAPEPRVEPTAWSAAEDVESEPHAESIAAESRAEDVAPQPGAEKVFAEPRTDPVAAEVRAASLEPTSAAPLAARGAPPRPRLARGAGVPSARIVLAIATALIGAGLLVLASWMFQSAAATADLSYTRAGFTGQALGLVFLGAHHIARPSRGRVVIAALFGVGAVLNWVVEGAIYSDQWDLAIWSHLADGLVLLLAGGFLVRAGWGSASPYASGLRAPAVLVIVDGSIVFLSGLALLELDSFSPEPFLALGALGVGVGYAVSAVMLIGALRKSSDRRHGRAGAGASAEGTQAVEPDDVAAPAAVVDEAAASVEDEFPSEAPTTGEDAPQPTAWRGEVAYERLTGRRTRAVIRLRLVMEHDLVLVFGVGWKTIQVDGAFVPIPRGRIAEFGLRDGDVERACVLESSPPAAGARPETSRTAHIDSILVDGIPIPLEQQDAAG